MFYSLFIYEKIHCHSYSKKYILEVVIYYANNLQAFQRNVTDQYPQLLYVVVFVT